MREVTCLNKVFGAMGFPITSIFYTSGEKLFNV